MKTISAHRVRIVLRRFGFRPASLGSGNGHERWSDDLGRTVHPVLRHKDINIESLCSLAWEFQAKGVCERREFWRVVRAI